MIKEEFLKIKEKLATFQFSSLKYVDYEAVKNFTVIDHSKSGIILIGRNSEKRMNEIHWATDHSDYLLHFIEENEKSFIITFVPENWISQFKSAGLEVYAIWNDYFKTTINSDESIQPSKILSDKDAKSLSVLTLSCSGQSRGFTGQSEQFCRDWLNSENLYEKPIHDRTVIPFYIENTLGGAVFVATYGKDKTLWIREIVVAPEHQGKGLGRKLMKMAFSYGMERNVKKVFLAADECNKNAIHLYKSLGFKCNPKDKQIDMIWLSASSENR